MYSEGIQPETLKEVARAHQEDFVGIEPAITESSLESLCEGDLVLEQLLTSMLQYAERYAVDVWEMQKFINDGKFDTEEGAAEFAEMDDARTRLHTALMESIAILSRALAKAGKDNEWVRSLTNGSSLDRAQCGAFALLLIYKRYLDTIH